MNSEMGARDRPTSIRAEDSGNKYEFSCWQGDKVYNHVFGLDIFNLYTPEAISAMIKDPIANNEALRRLSNELYSASGLYTQCVDYCTAMPTLDYVIIPKGRDKAKREKNRKLMELVLKTIRHKELVRDYLLKLMVDGIGFYYCEVAQNKPDNRKFLRDYDVEGLLEINETGVNISMIPLPTDFTHIVGRKNNSYVIALDLEYFNIYISEEDKQRKLKLYPPEVRKAYDKWMRGGTVGRWYVLDNTHTMVAKARSKMEEVWGRPLCLAAIKNILYNMYFQDTARGTLDEVNNRIFYETFPEGKDKGSCALTVKQQETQHDTVKNAILHKNGQKRATFFSVAAGTKLDSIEPDLSLLDEKNSSYIQDQIGIDLGFMANLLSGTGSGSYAAQKNNLELLLSEIMMWIEPITAELVKVINNLVIKDKNNTVDLRYLPNSILTRDKFTENMKQLYLQGKGSLSAWIASTGIDLEAYRALMDYELEEDFENKYPVHQTSYTMTNKTANTSDVGGRPTKDDSTNENTIVSKTNGANDLPSPSD